MLKAIVFLIVVWHGLMLGCVLQFTKDDVSLGAVARAVVLHDGKFLNLNCDYKKARIMCLTLFLLMNLIGYISSNIL
jgi:hypothetical protein